ncbi:phosphotransferase family protein [Gammaproteobacteria bacterium 50_400_T64]|nr:phosphotransferase family protein [Gammaproteobacteria bacterium 50_400_T64]
MTTTTDSLPMDTLGAYLADNIPGFGKLLNAEKFSGGQSNPTYMITTDSKKYVLRRKPSGELLPSAHAVDREFRVMSALAGSGVPVPTMHKLCDDDSIIGSMFYIMDFIDGDIFWDAQLTEVDKGLRAPMYAKMNEVLAALHSVDIAKADLESFGRPGNYFERQISRWTKQYRGAETETLDAMEKLMAWLPANMPEDDGQVSLIHGDYRLDNMIFAPGKAEVLAVLDWELSTLGHPYSDIAYQCMQLRMPADPALGNLAGLNGVDRAALGIPSEEEYVAAYCKNRGISEIPNWTFYLAFSFFRFAAILQGIMKRYLDGTASNEEALAYGKMAGPMAEIAMEYLAEQGRV